MKALKAILIVLGVLLAGAATLLYLYVSAPTADMRQRADRLPLPGDFVLVREEYGGSTLGLFGTLPDLHRTYHAPWPSLCENLGRMSERLGPPLGLAKVPRELAEHMCSFGVWYPAGWRGWIRGYRNYDVRIFAYEPGFLESHRIHPAIDSTLTLEQLKELYPDRYIPAGRALVQIQVIGQRGR